MAAEPTARGAVLMLLLGLCAPSASAEDWYWRPYLKAGKYGLGDGTTYNDAWAASTAIDWGAIQPGDTLFICGLHDNGYGDRSLTVGRSGTAYRRLTISGDCPGDPGTILSTGEKFSTTGWSGPDAQGVYWRAYGGTPSQAIDAEGYLIAADEPLTARSPCRSYYFSPAEKRFFYRPCGVPRVVYPMGPSPVILIRNQNYVTIADLAVSNAGRLIEVHGSTGIRLLRLHLHYAKYYSITLNGSTSAGRISGNLISDVGNGPYAVGAEGVHDDWIVENNLIQNVYGTSDSHGIGWQDGNRNVIRHNRLRNIEGSGITFYHTGRGATMSDNIIEDNEIAEVRSAASSRATNQRGIEFSGHNCPRTADDAIRNSIRFNRLSGIEREAIYVKAARPSSAGTYSVELVGNTVDRAGQGIVWFNGRLVSPMVHGTPTTELCQEPELAVWSTRPGFRAMWNSLQNIGGAFITPRPANPGLQAANLSGITASENAYYGAGQFVWPASAALCAGAWDAATGYCTVTTLSAYQSLSGTEQDSVQTP